MKTINFLKCYWLKLGDALGTIFGSIILTGLYFLIIGPLHLISRVAKKDFLNQQPKNSYWHTTKNENIYTLKQLELPF